MGTASKPSGTYVTALGYQLITKLLASGTALHFTRAAVGTGRILEGYSPDALTGLTQYKMDAELSEYGVQEDKAYLIAQISSANVQEGFLVTEVGVFATDPDKGEILYGYLDLSGDPTYIYASTSGSMAKFAEFQMYFLIGSLQKVTAVITAGSFVSRKIFDTEARRAKGAEDAISLRLDAEVLRAKEAEEKKINKDAIVNNTSTDRSDLVASAHVARDLQMQINKAKHKAVTTTEDGSAEQRIVKIERESTENFPNRIHFFSEKNYVGYVDLKK